MQIFTRARIYINTSVKALLFTVMATMGLSDASADWGVDFSRRSKEIRQKDYTLPVGSQKKESLFDVIFTPNSSPIQELVILNTERGFVPATIRVREGMRYKIHVVNVNEKDKNVSFVLDAFSEHHATYYGIIKSFMINPQKEGVYTFQSPETSAQGRLVVLGQKSPNLRQPASR